MARHIGIRHRVKQTAKGEARPTLIAIREGETVLEYELPTETDELDFLLDRFPVAWREIAPKESLKLFPSHHVKFRKVREEEDETAFPQDHLRKVGKKFEVASKVPSVYEGLTQGDTVAMVLGGSGDRFAFALSRRGEEIGARILRIPPFHLSQHRDEANKEKDHVTLIQLAISSPGLFYPTNSRDRNLIRVKEAFRARRDAQLERMACEQRLRQRLIGNIFLSEAGRYPEGTVEDEYQRVQANDVILQAILKEEKEREKELKRAVHQLDVWDKLFEPIEGCGEVIAAGIIAAVAEIRRFPTDAKLKAFAGVHVMPDGRLPRKRAGTVANWNTELRQSLYLLGDQFNRRPDSVWGQKLRENKRRLRERHPEITLNEKGKKQYTDIHIHKMSLWRTLTRFVEYLHREWMRLEQARREQ